MTRDKFAEILEEATKRRRDLRENKGKEYTRGADDPLSNFKRIAEELRMEPMCIWWVYYKKHQDAVLSFLTTGQEFSNESIESRIDDMQVYLDLLRGLVWEHKEKMLNGNLG